MRATPKCASVQRLAKAFLAERLLKSARISLGHPLEIVNHVDGGGPLLDVGTDVIEDSTASRHGFVVVSLVVGALRCEALTLPVAREVNESSPHHDADHGDPARRLHDRASFSGAERGTE